MSLYTLSGIELYKRANSYKNAEDYDNYAIYLTMAANYNHQEAINTIYHDIEIWHKQNFYATINFYHYHSFYFSQNSFSLHNLATMYSNGLGTDIDHKKAKKYYKAAAEKNNTLSLNNFAQIYVWRKKYTKAKNLYKKAIDLGCISALNNLAFMYTHENKEYGKAIRLYKRAIELGSETSMNNLAFVYMHNLDNGQNYAEAIKLYELAIQKGNISAYHNFAYMHVHGIGTEKNYDVAILLWQMAYSKGYIESLHELVNLFQFDYFSDKQIAIINYFNSINRLDKLKNIYAYDDYTIELIRYKYESDAKISALELENANLKMHIDSTPDGRLYLEAKREWEEKKIDFNIC